MRELIKNDRKILPLGAVHTLLIDGNFLIKRSYERTIKDGKYHTKQGHIGGCYMFMMSLRKLIRETNCTKCVICWDGENSGKLRYNIYSDYKANREGKTWHEKIELSDKQINELEHSKRTMLAQRVRTQQYCEELFIRQIEIHEIEADDLIAYYCKQYHMNEKITIYTNDRDMCQLLSYQNVSIILANLQKSENPLLSINRNNYFMYFEHHYENACLIKTICGDKSDNIPGIVGIKEKTLLNYFPDIKTQAITYETVLEKAKILKESRKGKDLKVINSLLNGTVRHFIPMKQTTKDRGIELFVTNKLLTDLSNPMLTEEAISEIHQIAELPLQSDFRGSKNLLEYMQEDGFLSVWNSDFTSYFKPFYSVILQEKELEKICKQEN